MRLAELRGSLPLLQPPGRGAALPDDAGELHVVASDGGTQATGWRCP